MFVSRAKFEALENKVEALVDENVALKKQNRELMADNERLSDSNFDLWWENKMLRFGATYKPQREAGHYFYTKGQKK